MKHTLALSRSICSLLLATPAAMAGVLHVDAGLTSGANDGSTWADAFQGTHGLQAALAAAAAGDQVFVAQGTYLATATGARGASFTLRDGVEVYGSFLGFESTPAERPPFGTAPSVLSGDLNGDDSSGLLGDNSFHVVRGGGVTPGAILDGFEVRAGNANGASGNSNDRGAGILCLAGSSPTVRNCRFIDNRSTFGGGAGYVNASTPRFADCSFENNQGGSFGGAFDVASSGPLAFDRCSFTGNTADRGGALEIFATNGATVSNSLFHGNVATGTGGGGAIWLGSGGVTQVSNCTLVANMSTVNGVGGLRVQGATAIVASTILWDNSGPGGGQAASNQITSTANVVYSIVKGGFAGAGNLALDPLFQDAAGGNFALTPGSAAIDAGSNAGVPVGLTLDLARAPRFVDDPSVPDTGLGIAPIVDIGALEFQASVGVSYCTAGTSASGCQASLSAAGKPSASAPSGFFVTANGVEGAKDGLFFFGTNGRQAQPWGNGASLQCVVPPVSRTELLNGTGTAGACDGVLSLDLNAQWCPTCPGANQNPGAGALVQIQLWYRDPFNTSNQTTSFSDALEVSTVP